MLFSRLTESDKMRAELIEHCNKNFVESSLQQLDDFTESIKTGIKSETGNSDSPTEQAMANAERSYKIAQLEIEQIRKMSEGDIKQLYYKTFHRWHPVT